MHVLLLVILFFPAFLFSSNLEQIIEKAIEDNSEVQSLEAQILQLEYQAEAASKWDGLGFNFGFNALNLDNPSYRKDAMQSISFGISQKLDLFAKKSLQGDKLSIQRQIKIVELKMLKKNIIKGIKIGMIRNYQNKYKQEILQNTLRNIEILKDQINSNLTNTALAELYKLEVLATKLQIKLNQIAENTRMDLIALNEVSFGDYADIVFEKPVEVELPDDYYKSSYELQIKKLEQQLSFNDVSLAKREFLSDPTIGVSYVHRNAHYDFVNFAISFSLPTYGKERFALLSAKQQLQMVNSSLTSKENEVRSKVRRLENTISKKQKELDLIKTVLIPQNEKLVALYKSNLSSASKLSEYYTALNDLLDSRLLEVDVLGNIWVAFAELESIGDSQ